MSNPAPPSKATYVNSGSVIGTSVVFIVLGAAVVIGRFFVRRLKRASIGPDDWLALAALFFTILYCTTQIVAAAIHTEGWHSPPAPHGLQSSETALPPIQVRFKKVQYVLNITFVLVIGSIRLSILFLYRRIFRGKSFNIAWWAMVILTVLWTAVFFFTSVFQCGTHFSAFWSSFAENAKHCIYIFGQVVALAVTDVALDVAVLILPLPFVWKLQMPNKQKLGVSIVFLLGMFSVAAGATRMAMNIDVNFLHHPGGTAPVLGLRADDVVGIVGFTLFWQLVQVGVALVASNLLTLRPLYHDIWPDGLLTSLRSQLLSSRNSSAHLRRKTADQSFEDTDHLNSSTQGFHRLNDPEQHMNDVPLHSLRSGDDKLAIRHGQIGVQREITATAEHI